MKGKLGETTYQIKYMKPFSLYLKEIEGKYKGTEIYYLPEKSEDNLYVRPGGVIGSVMNTLHFKAVPLSIDSKVIKERDRHPISEFGIGSFLEKYSMDFERGLKRKELYVSVDTIAEREDGERIELILKDKKHQIE